jgi:hypothetical protein
LILSWKESGIFFLELFSLVFAFRSLLHCNLIVDPFLMPSLSLYLFLCCMYLLRRLREFCLNWFNCLWIFCCFVNSYLYSALADLYLFLGFFCSREIRRGDHFFLLCYRLVMQWRERLEWREIRRRW